MKLSSIPRNIGSLIFVLFFIGGQTFAAILPLEYQKIFLNTAFLVFAVLIFYMLRFKRTVYVNYSLYFAVTFFATGLLNIFIHNANNYFTLVAPLAAFGGVYYLSKHYINFLWIDLFFIFLYIFFIIVYYSVIPDFFYRPGFDEDAVVFDMSSSNAIPISLNLTLYAYLILNKFYAQNNISKILFFAFINIVLVFIQQSRAGLFVSIVLLFIVSYDYSKKLLKWLSILMIPILILSVQTIGEFIFELNDVIGNVTDIESIGEEARGQGQIQFFQNMDAFTFFFGHTTKYYSDEGNIYTFNVFLDIWDRYGIFQLVALTLIVFYRILRNDSFLFPVYYFLPFFCYAFVESLFFPNYWDVIIYLLLFVPKDSIEENFAPTNFKTPPFTNT